MSEYDPVRDAQTSYTFALLYMRHKMLLSGDAWAHEAETVDLMMLWSLR